MKCGNLFFKSCMAITLTIAPSFAADSQDGLPPLIPAPVIEEPTAHVEVDYSAFIGGLSVATLTLAASWDETRYSLSSQLRTEGMANSVFPSQFHNTAQGTFSGKRIAPALYSTNYKAANETRQVRIEFDGVQPTLVDARPVYEMDAQLSEMDKRHSLDPMSSYLSLITGMTATEDNPCGQKVPIYDGRQRYNLNVKFVKELDVTDSIVDIYSGPGYHCQMQYQQIAGFKRNAKKNSRLPYVDVYLAKIADGKYRVPLRMNIGTDFGFAVIRAIRLDVDLPGEERDTASVN